jgi:hypothetical protein
MKAIGAEQFRKHLERAAPARLQRRVKRVQRRGQRIVELARARVDGVRHDVAFAHRPSGLRDPGEIATQEALLVCIDYV